MLCRFNGEAYVEYRSFDVGFILKTVDVEGRLVKLQVRSFSLFPQIIFQFNFCFRHMIRITKSIGERFLRSIIVAYMVSLLSTMFPRGQVPTIYFLRASVFSEVNRQKN